MTGHAQTPSRHSPPFHGEYSECLAESAVSVLALSDEIGCFSKKTNEFLKRFSCGVNLRTMSPNIDVTQHDRIHVAIATVSPDVLQLIPGGRSTTI